LDVLDVALFEAGAIAAGLFAQPCQQVVAVDARRKARVVARARNPRSPARAGVHHHAAASEARQVQCRGEARGAAADDQAVDHDGLRVGLCGRHCIGRWRGVASRSRRRR
ncbi:MAG: hypothetical protein VR76_10900, partial [Pseudomonas sp. BRH_c35]